MIPFLIFVTWLVLPLAIWYYRKIIRAFCRRHWPYFTITGVAFYFLFILYIWFIGIMYEVDLNEFDLDGDGLFSGDEMTPDAQKAMDRLTHDTGRSFAPITAIPVSLTFTSLFFPVYWLVSQRKAKRTKLKMENRKDSFTSER